ncbi:MAG: uridine diphosphate-N-acetylglucosamine-binding protein YvcK [Actinomycetes bacterium]|jgi:uncharacterized cofD-like protein
MTQPKVVALGGGHGLAATLSALRKVTSEITAIVTVADNGGSSGRLREEFPIFPPGDLRMALAALCSDDEWGRSWAEIMQYRFTSQGPLDGHPVGNLLLAALWDRDEDPVAGLDRVGALLKVVGRVLPMAAEPLDIEAEFEVSNGETEIARGQIAVAGASGRLRNLTIIPENPPARIEALSAIAHADWITMGPGSWISSVLPHLLIPAQRDALISSKAQKILLLNLDPHPSQGGDELAGKSPQEHLKLIAKYAPHLMLSYVIADTSVVQQPAELEKLVKSFGGRLITADLRQERGSIHHNVEKLAQLLASVMNETLVG